MDLGFLFWRCVAFYGVAPEELLRTKVRVFWSMAEHIDRLQAERDLGLVDLMTVAQCGDRDTHAKFRAALASRIGTPVRRELPRSSREEILELIREV